MKSDAKKIQSAAKVEGEEFVRYIQCDLSEIEGCPVAVLFWPSSSDTRRVWYQIQQTDLSPSDSEGVAYVHTGEPLHIPSALAEIERAALPLSPDGLRLGFFFLHESPADIP